jgi:hypothetical protein
MPPEHLFDEREADTKYSRDVPNRLFSLLNGGPHSTAEFFGIGSHTA